MSLTDIFKTKGDGKAAVQQKATDLLKEDHKKVKALFAEYRALDDKEEANNPAERGRLFSEILRELTIHSKIEEEVFYPAVKRAPEEDASRIVSEATEEHAIVKTLLRQLQGLPPGEEIFEAKMKVLMEGVEHHAKEEEDEMFPEAEAGLGDEALRRLGARMSELKGEFAGGQGGSRLAPRQAASAPRKRHPRATNARASSSRKSAKKSR